MILRKIAAISLILLFVISCISTVTINAEGIINFSVDTINGKAGDEVTINISIANNPGMVAAKLDLAYDNAKLEAVSVDASELFSGALFEGNLAYSANVIRIVWITAGDDMKENGILYSVKFKLLADINNDSSLLTLSHGAKDLFNDKYEMLQSNVLAVDPNEPNVTISVAENQKVGEDIIFTGITNLSISNIAVFLESANQTVAAAALQDIGNGTFKGVVLTNAVLVGEYALSAYVVDDAAGTSMLMAKAKVMLTASNKYTAQIVSEEGGIAKLVVDGVQTDSALIMPGDTVELITAISNGGVGPDSSATYTFEGWGSSVPVTFSGQNTSSSFVMPSTNVTITAMYNKTGGTQPNPTPTNPPTPGKEYPGDIAGHWSEVYVKNVIDNGIMKGYPDGNFAPSNGLTRAEFATAMVRYLDVELKDGKVFADTAGHWSEKYVATLVDAGIINGYDVNTFGVDDPITREQIAVILNRSFNTAIANTTNGDAFADDADISLWAKDAVYAVWQAGFMVGDETGFRPQASATRAEIATILSRLLDAGVR